MLRSRGVHGDVGQIDVGLLAGGQLDLGLLGGFLEALHREGILTDIDTGFFDELLGEEVDHPQVEVLATEEGVTVSREHLELALAVDLGDLDDRDVESAATEIVDRDLAVATRLVEAIGQRRRGRLVDDALDVESGDATGVLGRLALRIIEVRRDRDHGIGDLFTEKILRGLLHLHEHARRDLGRRHLSSLCLDPRIAVLGLDDAVRHHADVLLDDLLVETPTDESLHGVERVGRIGDRLALGRLADHHFVVLGEGDDGGRGAIPLTVLDHARLAAIHNRDARVRGPKIDADDFAHGGLLRCVRYGPVGAPMSLLSGVACG